MVFFYWLIWSIRVPVKRNAAAVLRHCISTVVQNVDVFSAHARIYLWERGGINKNFTASDKSKGCLRRAAHIFKVPQGWLTGWNAAAISFFGPHRKKQTFFLFLGQKFDLSFSFLDETFNARFKVESISRQKGQMLKEWLSSMTFPWRVTCWTCW